MLRQTLNSRLKLYKKRPWHKPGGSGSCTRSQHHLSTASRGCLLQKTQTSPFPWWHIPPAKVCAAGMSREKVLTPELTADCLNIGTLPKFVALKATSPVKRIFSSPSSFIILIVSAPTLSSSPACRESHRGAVLVGCWAGRALCAALAGLLWLRAEGFVLVTKGCPAFVNRPRRSRAASWTTGRTRWPWAAPGPRTRWAGGTCPPTPSPRR